MILVTEETGSVSTLVLLADMEDGKPDFETTLWGQIKSLREQLEKDPEHMRGNTQRGMWPTPPQILQRSPQGLFGPRAVPPWRRDAPFAESNVMMSRDISSAGNPPTNETLGEGRRDLRSLALAAAAVGRSYIA